MSYPKTVTLTKNLFLGQGYVKGLGLLSSRTRKTWEESPVTHIGKPGDVLTLDEDCTEVRAYSTTITCGGTGRRAYLTTDGIQVFLSRKQVS